MRNLGFAIGMVLGAAAGLFLAPRRGEETRTRVMEAAKEAADRASQPLQSASAALRQRGRVTHTPCAPTL